MENKVNQENGIDSLVRFSLAELEMMEQLEVPIEQDIDLGLLDPLFIKYELNESQTSLLSSRADLVLKYKDIIRKYISEDSGVLFKKIFGREPKGKINTEPGPYHLIINSSHSEEWTDTLIGYIPKANQEVKIDELRGLIEIRTNNLRYIEKILTDIFNSKDNNFDKENDNHERQHVRYNMVVKKGKSGFYKELSNKVAHPYIDLSILIMPLYEDLIKNEISAVLAETDATNKSILPNKIVDIDEYEKQVLTQLNKYKGKRDVEDIEKTKSSYLEFFNALRNKSIKLLRNLKTLNKTIPGRELAYIISNTTMDGFIKNSDAIEKACLKYR